MMAVCLYHISWQPREKARGQDLLPRNPSSKGYSTNRHDAQPTDICNKIGTSAMLKSSTLKFSSNI